MNQEARLRLQVRLSKVALDMLDELQDAHGDNTKSTVIERAIKHYYLNDDIVTSMRKRRSIPRGK
jgi:metal-responsive CopG/Arc/MetJ family transcriptional regulator